MTLFLTLIPVSVLCGLLSGAVFRRFASPETGQTISRILAHVMELRLFLDEPGVVLRAQRDLVLENLRLLRLLAAPMLITAPLFALVIWQGDGIYGRAPLRAGEAVVVTARIPDGSDAEIRLSAPADVAVETPAVHVPRLHEVSWRIRPVRPFSGQLALSSGAEWIDIPWPRATMLGASWIVWFVGISAVSAWLMPRRFTGRWLAVLAIAGLSPHAKAADKTPVILISIDTLRADHLSAYGYRTIRTPNIDAIADKGTVYQRIDTQIPLTLPSHTSLMTSTYPFENQVEANGESVPSGAVTLASVLRGNGYRTAAFIGSMILDRRFGLDKGFDFYDSPFEAAAGSTPNPFSARVRRDASLVVRAAGQWLGKNRGEPVFAFIHFYDLHTPYTLPQVAGLTPNVTAYDAELLHVDEAVGRLREILVRAGLWDRALIVLLADHGESLGDHGESSHGYFIYESTMHVPLLIHWPSGTAKLPERIAEPGGLIDVAPTVLDFLHIAVPPSFAGVSLLPGHGERVIYGESVYPRDAFGWASLRSLQSGSYKYIDAPKAELYDLAKDPGERTNLLPAGKDAATRLRTRLEALLQRPVPAGPSTSPAMSARARELFGSLGYTAAGRQSGKSRIVDPKDKIAEHEAFESGLALLYSGRYPQAIAGLGRIVARDALNVPAICALGEAHLRAGNAGQALKLWQLALERDPKNRVATDSIGEYWLQRKDYAQACRYIPAAAECKTQPRHE